MGGELVRACGIPIFFFPILARATLPQLWVQKEREKERLNLCLIADYWDFSRVTRMDDEIASNAKKGFRFVRFFFFFFSLFFRRDMSFVRYDAKIFFFRYKIRYYLYSYLIYLFAKEQKSSNKVSKKKKTTPQQKLHHHILDTHNTRTAQAIVTCRLHTI